MNLKKFVTVFASIVASFSAVSNDSALSKIFNKKGEAIAKKMMKEETLHKIDDRFVLTEEEIILNEDEIDILGELERRGLLETVNGKHGTDCSGDGNGWGKVTEEQ